jgi:hypothetical protein
MSIAKMLFSLFGGRPRRGGFEIAAALSYGGVSDALLRLIALSTKKPESQSARVVIGFARNCLAANAQ